ncbi:MAG: amidohydrolase [Rhodoluna sp.]
MRIRYSNAVLWRGLDDEPKCTDFDVVDGLFAVSQPDQLPDYVVDLHDHFVMPSFRDGHAHPLFAGREHRGPDVTYAKSLVEIQSIVKAYAAQNSEISWIDGAAYDRSIEARFTRTELDEAIADRPLILHGADHHTLWLNTRALELCGLMNTVPDLSVGSIDVDSQGKPTGILREWEAMQIALNCLPALTMAQELECLAWAQDQLIRLGVTEVQDAWIDPGMTEIYLEALNQNQLQIAVSLAFRADPKSWRTDFNYFESVLAEVQSRGDERLTVNAIKFFVDGVLGSSTASVIEPYVAGPNIHGHGEQVWDFAEIVEAATAANRMGLQLHLHAIGDLAVRTALDIIERVNPDFEAVIAHTELISDSDLIRFSTLNVTANLEPLWAREDGQLMSCVEQVGRKRIDSMYRMRDLLNAQARLSFGSDWPVSSPDPMLGVATAVNRSLPGQSSWTKAQALTAREAIIAYTARVAQQLSNSTRDGVLTQGQPADFVVLSDNPLTASDKSLFGIKVLGTSISDRRPLLGF